MRAHVVTNPTGGRGGEAAAAPVAGRISAVHLSGGGRGAAGTPENPLFVEARPLFIG
ncbi:hypothetical protein T484DRAFT_1771502 [Baffinella frigidus]|nr:hypothetical protein T484DRAFT_1771502 [Cryptophyta sp. CCMP2293]